tara:strand:+ start:1406 stop:2416 length:1011 start_codon:yes stop_codon:yes gene_type:complete
MSRRRLLIRLLYSFALLCAALVTVGIVLLLESKDRIFDQSVARVDTVEETDVAFPVSVNIHTKKIVEDPAVNDFFTETLANSTESEYNWWNQMAALLFANDWYQNLASPVSRIVVIWPGERKEEVTKHIGDVLRWSEEDREDFQLLMDTAPPVLTEGKYFPGQYVTHRYATPHDVADTIYTSLEDEVFSRYTNEVAAQVPLEDALIIASLIEREASSFSNMREVSGVIWNRLFIDMPLQLDATLQYVRGSKTYEPAWWPVVRPRDKFIDSPYNTYQNEGLPPAPIASPSTEAILAALNPIQTECLFYFHTDDGGYYCSETYEEHVQKLRSLYGRGK